MKPIRNLIFDFDGTLADTTNLIVTTMQQTIHDLGLPFRTDDQIKATIGVRLEEIPSILWPYLKDVGETFAMFYRKNFEDFKNKIQIVLFPGVKDILKDLKEKDYQLAIATSRSRSSVEELTENLGIRGSFDCILGGDDVSKGKPDPESIFSILTKMGWNDKETMMIGDMRVDIQMGKNAGVLTCGVTYGNGTVLDLYEARADIIIDSFKELPDRLLL